MAPQLAATAGGTGYPRTPRGRAIDRLLWELSAHLIITLDRAEVGAHVDEVLDAIAEPDDEMLAAGLDELRHDMSIRDQRHDRDLVRAIWRAMLERAMAP
jgi:hypothetical protein